MYDRSPLIFNLESDMNTFDTKHGYNGANYHVFKVNIYGLIKKKKS